MAGRKALYDAEGCVRYDLLATAEFFQTGLPRLEEGASRYCVALMCSEEDPAACHRGLLIERVLRDRGYQMEHIRGNGTRQPDSEVFTPPAEPPQASLFDHAKEPAWKSIPSVLPGKSRRILRAFEGRESRGFIELNNSPQLAAFAKRDDLQYFLRDICGAEYIHEPLLAPTQELLDLYKKKKGSWADYERNFLALMKERKVAEVLDRSLFSVPAALLQRRLRLTLPSAVSTRTL